METTRDILLDTAERLFARHGIEATSLRMITQEAGVNLAAVNYHFGSKENLVLEVLDRRIAPLNRERMRLLGAAGRRSRRPSLEAVLHAFAMPVFAMMQSAGEGERAFVQLMGRIHLDSGPQTRFLLSEEFSDVMRAFDEAIARAVPALTREERLWRFHFVLGAMIHTVTCAHLLDWMSGGTCFTDDPDSLAARFVEFAAGGMKNGVTRRGAAAVRGAR